MQREQRFERRERTLVDGHAGRQRAVDLDVLTAHDERAAGIAPEEREAAPTLGVLDRLEQEPRRAVDLGADELGERRHRRLEVGQHLAPDRHDGVVPGERAELVACRPDRSGAGHGLAGRSPPPNARKKQDRSPVWQAPRALLLDHEQQRVAVAVVVGLAHPLAVARGVALAPQLLARPAPEDRAPFVERAAQGLVVHPGEHQHPPGPHLLDDCRGQAVGVPLDSGEVVIAGDNRCRWSGAG